MIITWLHKADVHFLRIVSIRYSELRVIHSLVKVNRCDADNVTNQQPTFYNSHHWETLTCSQVEEHAMLHNSSCGMNEAITECNVEAFPANQGVFIDVTLKSLTEQNRREEEDYCLPSFFILRIEPICVFQSPTHFSTIFTNVKQFHTNSMEEWQIFCESSGDMRFPSSWQTAEANTKLVGSNRKYTQWNRILDVVTHCSWRSRSCLGNRVVLAVRFIVTHSPRNSCRALVQFCHTSIRKSSRDRSRSRFSSIRI